ncbi:MAG: DUF1553 domain-containing protein, partial [Verrucomicrobiota bacterium]
VDTTMTVWMGLTMSCARCHDHKYDPLTHVDYYGLVSFFDNVPESGRAIKFGNSEPWISAPTDTQEAELEEIDYRLTEAKRRFADSAEALATAQAAWEASAPLIDEVSVSSGLTAHFGKDGSIVSSGEKPVKMETGVTNVMGNHRFTLAMRITPGQTNKGVILTNESAGTTRKGIFIDFREGHLRFSMNSRWIAGVGMVETLRKFQPGETFHLTVANDGTQRAQGIRLWIDGAAEQTRVIHNTNSNVAKGDAKQPLFIGGSKHHPGWEGRVDDLRFYEGRELSDTEVAILAEPDSVDELIRMEHGERSEIEEKKVTEYFLTHAVSGKLKKQSDEVRAIEAERIAFVDRLPTTMVMEEARTSKDTFLRVRGEYHNHGEKVDSAIPEIFGELEVENPNRLDFARWLVGDENPLTARVAVNQYWQMLFGRGLVKTAEDFGTQGSLPSHPDLLDWLAVEFKESGWDTRAILKKMVLSRTYRQSSALRPGDREQDPENIYLARSSRLKLPGNILRDKALAASGLLVNQIGGPSVKPYQPAGMWKEASNFTYKQDKGDKLYRRSLYTYWKRTLAPPTMAVLDTADREWCSVKPKRTNTPLQALALMNETGFFESARKLGERMMKEGGVSAEDRLRFAFRKVLTRSPNEEELAHLVSSHQRYLDLYRDDEKLAREVLTVGESESDSHDVIELAAATAIANVLFNLEEASVRE